MLFRPNPSSGVPIYLQLMEQVKHSIETGALRPGEQLPGIRPLAEELVINPNTVAKAYRELEHEGVIGLPADAENASVEIRRRAAFVSDDKDLYDYMTVAEIIRFTAAFFPTWRADLEQTYARKFELPLDRKVKALSRGTRTKLTLLLALCRRAELLILDEPTSRLDPAVTAEVMQILVSRVAGEPMTVFFSSHQIREVDSIADRVTIIDHGRAVVSGSLDDLREQYRRVQLVFDGDAPDATFRSPGVVRTKRSGRILTVLSSAGADRILDEARALNPVSTDVVPVTLKEIFLESVAAGD